jgi:hypothetical protein
MSPEILKHSPYTTKSDLWSLGVILYELIVKEHPYYVTEAKELMNFVEYGHNIDLTKIKNDYYRNIIKLLLERDVNTRMDAKSFFNELLLNNNESFNYKSSPISIKSKSNNDIISPSSSFSYLNSENSNNYSNNTSNNNSPVLEPSSAPLNNHVLTSYLEDKLNEIDCIGTSMPIYGSSPILKRKSDIEHILSQSAKSLSNFFNFKL